MVNTPSVSAATNECTSVDADAFARPTSGLGQRPPDYERESRTLRLCLAALAESPQEALDALPRIAVELFPAGSAGISLVDSDGDRPRSIWAAVAGQWSHYVGLAAPQQLNGLWPPPEDCLSVPFTHAGVAAGALWIVSHDSKRQFDAEDLRQLQRCSAWASTAYAYQVAGYGAPSDSAVAQALRAADRRKNIFIATLAHELRDPLSAIVAAARVLRHPGAERDGTRAVDTLERQAGHMRRLIDDTLDAARIAEGKISLRRERVDVCGILRDSCADMSNVFREGRQTLAISLPPGPVWLTADRTRLRQVITNLLANAATYSPRAGVIAVAMTVDVAAIVIRVQDAGSGISAAALPHVFDLFTQETATTTGLGIGLAVVRNLVELHGGSVSVRSEGVGRGSEFIVRLPAAEFEAVEPVH